MSKVGITIFLLSSLFLVACQTVTEQPIEQEVDMEGSSDMPEKKEEISEAPVIAHTVEEAQELINSNTTRIEISQDIWKQLLTDEQYYILINKGTERPYTGDLLEIKETGTYITAGCKQPVFRSETKFESGTGWPSFYEPISEDAIILEADYKLGYRRWEILSSRCNEHLGHVFNDGPEPTGLRYCINSDALEFVPDTN